MSDFPHVTNTLAIFVQSPHFVHPFWLHETVSFHDLCCRRLSITPPNSVSWGEVCWWDCFDGDKWVEHARFFLEHTEIPKSNLHTNFTNRINFTLQYFEVPISFQDGGGVALVSSMVNVGEWMTWWKRRAWSEPQLGRNQNCLLELFERVWRHAGWSTRLKTGTFKVCLFHCFQFFYFFSSLANQYLHG